MERAVASSWIRVVMDGCKGFRRLFGCAARSKLHEEYFVKKLSPRFHLLVSAISRHEELIEAYHS
jgi:hypothetical protein